MYTTVYQEVDATEKKSEKAHESSNSPLLLDDLNKLSQIQEWIEGLKRSGQSQSLELHKERSKDNQIGSSDSKNESAKSDPFFSGAPVMSLSNTEPMDRRSSNADEMLTLHNSDKELTDDLKTGQTQCPIQEKCDTEAKTGMKSSEIGIDGEECLTDEEIAVKLLTSFRDIRILILKSLERDSSTSSTAPPMLNGVLDNIHQMMTSTIRGKPSIEGGWENGIIRDIVASQESFNERRMDQNRFNSCQYVDKIDMMIDPIHPPVCDDIHSCISPMAYGDNGCCISNIRRKLSKMLRMIVQK